MRDSIATRASTGYKHEEHERDSLVTNIASRGESLASSVDSPSPPPATAPPSTPLHLALTHTLSIFITSLATQWLSQLEKYYLDDIRSFQSNELDIRELINSPAPLKEKLQALNILLQTISKKNTLLTSAWLSPARKTIQRLLLLDDVLRVGLAEGGTTLVERFERVMTLIDELLALLTQTIATPVLEKWHKDFEQLHRWGNTLLRLHKAPISDPAMMFRLLSEQQLLPDALTDIAEQMRLVYGHINTYLAMLKSEEMSDAQRWLKGNMAALGSAVENRDTSVALQLFINMASQPDVLQEIEPYLNKFAPELALALRLSGRLSAEMQKVQQESGMVWSAVDLMQRLTRPEFIHSLKDESIPPSELTTGLTAVLEKVGSYITPDNATGTIVNNMFEVMRGNSDMTWKKFVLSSLNTIDYWQVGSFVVKKGVHLIGWPLLLASQLGYAAWNSDFISNLKDTDFKDIPRKALMALNAALHESGSPLNRALADIPLFGTTIRATVQVLNSLVEGGLLGNENWMEDIAGYIKQFGQDNPLIVLFEQMIKMGLMINLWHACRRHEESNSVKQMHDIDRAQKKLTWMMNTFPQQRFRHLLLFVEFIPLLRRVYDHTGALPKMSEGESALGWGARLAALLNGQTAGLSDREREEIGITQNMLSEKLLGFSLQSIEMATESALTGESLSADVKPALALPPELPGKRDSSRTTYGTLKHSPLPDFSSAGFSYKKWQQLVNKQREFQPLLLNEEAWQEQQLDAQWEGLKQQLQGSLANNMASSQAVLTHVTQEMNRRLREVVQTTTASLETASTQAGERLASAVQTGHRLAGRAAATVGQWANKGADNIKAASHSAKAKWDTLAPETQTAIGLAAGGSAFATGLGIAGLYFSRKDSEKETISLHETTLEELMTMRTEVRQDLETARSNKSIARGITLATSIMSGTLLAAGGGYRVGEWLNRYRDDPLTPSGPASADGPYYNPTTTSSERSQSQWDRVREYKPWFRLGEKIAAGLVIPAGIGGLFWWRYAQQETRLEKNAVTLMDKKLPLGILLRQTMERMEEIRAQEKIDLVQEELSERSKYSTQQSEYRELKQIADALLDQIIQISNTAKPDIADDNQGADDWRNIVAPPLLLHRGRKGQADTVKLRLMRPKSVANEGSPDINTTTGTESSVLDLPPINDLSKLNSLQLSTSLAAMSDGQREEVFRIFSDRETFIKNVKSNLADRHYIYDKEYNRGSSRVSWLKEFKGYSSTDFGNKKAVGILHDLRESSDFPDGYFFHFELTNDDNVIFKKDYIPSSNNSADYWHLDIANQINKDMENQPANLRIDVSSFTYESYYSTNPKFNTAPAKSNYRNVFFAPSNSLITDATWRFERTGEELRRSVVSNNFPTDKVYRIELTDEDHNLLFKKSYYPQGIHYNQQEFQIDEDAENEAKREVLKAKNWHLEIQSQIMKDMAREPMENRINLLVKGNTLLFFKPPQSHVSNVSTGFIDANNTDSNLATPEYVANYLQDNASELPKDIGISVNYTSKADPLLKGNKTLSLNEILSPSFITRSYTGNAVDGDKFDIRWSEDIPEIIKDAYINGISKEYRDYSNIKDSGVLLNYKGGVKEHIENTIHQISLDIKKGEEAYLTLDPISWIDQRMRDEIASLPGALKNFDPEKMIGMDMDSQTTNAIGMVTSAKVLTKEKRTLREMITQRLEQVGHLPHESYGRHNIRNIHWPEYLKQNKLLEKLQSINFEADYEDAITNLTASQKKIQSDYFTKMVENKILKIEEPARPELNDRDFGRLVMIDNEPIPDMFVCELINSSSLRHNFVFVSLENSATHYAADARHYEYLKKDEDFIAWVKSHLSLKHDTATNNLTFSTKNYSKVELAEKLKELHLTKSRENIMALVTTNNEYYISELKQFSAKFLTVLATPLVIGGLIGLPHATAVALSAVAALGLAPVALSYLTEDTNSGKKALFEEAAAIIAVELFGLGLAKMIDPFIKNISKVLTQAQQTLARAALSKKIENIRNFLTQKSKLRTGLTTTSVEVTKPQVLLQRLTKEEDELLNMIIEALENKSTRTGKLATFDDVDDIIAAGNNSASTSSTSVTTPIQGTTPLGSQTEEKGLIWLSVNTADASYEVYYKAVLQAKIQEYIADQE